MADLCRGVHSGQTSVAVTNPSLFSVGASVELRNEYRFGRANYPKVHHAVITAIEENLLHISPGPPTDAFWDSRGSFIVQRNTENFHLTSVQKDDRRTIFVAESELLSATCELVADRNGCVQINLARNFHQSINVQSEVLTLELAGPLNRVYRKNRQVHHDHFLTEYFLGDQAFAFSPAGYCDVFLESSTVDAALALRAPLSYIPRSTNKFRSAPYDLEAMKVRDVATYASAKVVSDNVEFSLDLTAADGRPKKAKCAGLRLVLYGKSARPESFQLTAIDDEGFQVSQVEVRVDSYPSDPVIELLLPSVDEAASLHVLARKLVGNDFMVSFAEVLTDGSDYEARLIADDYRLHRHYQVAHAASTDGTGGAHITSKHWSRRDTGATELSRWKVTTGPCRADLRPRVMHLPDGFSSAMIWTEHADATSLESNRAVAFGRSDIEDPRSAVGGFVASGLPITKTIFYANPSNLQLPRSQGPQASLRDTPGFLELCNELYRLGWDIGLHSPQPDNSTREVSQAAINFVSERFGARTWIDHSCSVVRNGVSAFGAVPDSKDFILHFLKDSGMTYIWEFASEDHAEAYLGGLSLLQTRVGDWAYTPLTWGHPDLPGLTIWGTTAGNWLGIYSGEELDSLVGEWGIAVAHNYPGYHYPTPEGSQFFRPGQDGAQWSTTEQFEETLERLVERQANGDLGVITIRRWLDYKVMAEKVLIDSTGDGWQISNPTAERVMGFSFAVEGACRLDFKPLGVRQTQHGQIFTTDLEPGQILTIHPQETVAHDS